MTSTTELIGALQDALAEARKSYQHQVMTLAVDELKKMGSNPRVLADVTHLAAPRARILELEAAISLLRGE